MRGDANAISADEYPISLFDIPMTDQIIFDQSSMGLFSRSTAYSRIQKDGVFHVIYSITLMISHASNALISISFPHRSSRREPTSFRISPRLCETLVESMNGANGIERAFQPVFNKLVSSSTIRRLKTKVGKKCTLQES